MFNLKDFITGYHCPYFPEDCRNLPNRAIPPIFADLPTGTYYAITSLRYNGDYGREEIQEHVRSGYGYSIREIVGEYSFPYGVFPEHYVVIYNLRHHKIIPFKTFWDDVNDIGRSISKGKVIVVNPEEKYFEHLEIDGGKSVRFEKAVTRKNALQKQFGENWKLTQIYAWRYDWKTGAADPALKVLGEIRADYTSIEM
ncbi:MAG: hypothetical protein LUG50_13335 [Planctomycetaceae bacterium]|nr:hypothetical protein [Planctomycetaceae bacterium]